MTKIDVVSRSILKNIQPMNTLNHSYFKNLLRNKHSYSTNKFLPQKTIFNKSTNYFYSTKHSDSNNSHGKFRWLSTVITASIAGSLGFYLNNNNNNYSSFFPSLVSKQHVEDSKSTLSVTDLGPLKYNTNKEEINNLIIDLKNILENNPDNYTNTQSELKQHADSEFNTHHPNEDQRPIIVLFPHTTEQVSQLLKLCHDANVPVVPFSGGSSLEGHFLPTRYPTVCIDISKYMDNIIKLNKADLDVTVQGGVPWEDLNDFLNEQGLLFGCDPGPGALVAGCVANSCSGTNAYRYGTMKENILSLTVVLPDGTIIKTKKRPKKSSAEYNLNGLFCGSEGTLGIVTEVVVKCHVKPQYENVVVVSFPSIADAAACASHITQEGIPVNAMELLDDNMMQLINNNDQTERNDWVEKPTLFFKIGGKTPVIIKELIQEMKKVSEKHNAINFEFATDEDTVKELWEARKVALWSVLDSAKKLSKDAKMWTTDVAVPISKFSKVIDETKKEMNQSGLINAIVGHAGDGNFHAFIVYTNKDELRKCDRIVKNMVKRALDAEGTCTGEHGVGIGKRQFLLQELGDKPIDLMRKIKLSIDPKRIMNPDKVFTIDPNEPEYVEHEF